MNLTDRINALLADKIAAPADDSLLHSALEQATDVAQPDLTPTEQAYQRVEILLAAWEEMHRQTAPLIAALERIAESYPWVAYTPDETVHDRGDYPTNRRIARESLHRREDS